MKVAVIGDRYTVTGFAVLGVKKLRIATTPEETEEGLTRFLNDPEVGMIIILDRLAEAVRSVVTGVQSKKRVYPIIIEIPGKEGAIMKEDVIHTMIRKAVGIEMKKGGGTQP